MTGVWAGVRCGVAAAGELVLPGRCASCHGPGAPLCRGCAAAVYPASGQVGVMTVRLEPAPRGMPACWAGARFEGPLRLAVTAYKDEERRDLRPALAGLLSGALGTALAADAVLRRRRALGGGVLVVPVPTGRRSRRRRGDDPVGALAAAVVGALNGVPVRGRGRSRTQGLVVAPALRHTRAVADQARLDRVARAANLAGAVRVEAAWQPVVRGSACVLVDDVVTTGATLAEAARALRAAGAAHVVAATVAATPRRLTPPLWVAEPRTSVRL